MPRKALARLIVVAVMLVLLAPALSAAPTRSDPQEALHGFKMRHWSIEEGAPGRINAFAQTPDGFLWIGGVDGLMRFDGLTFERVGPASSSTERIVVARLLAASDGTLWIGLARKRGVLMWRNGRLEDARMPNPSREVNDIAQGPDGAIWVSRGGRAERSLARYFKGRWTEFDTASGLPLEPAWNPFFAKDGTLWLTTESGVYRKLPGAKGFEYTGIATVPRATMAQAGDGTIWLTEKERTRPIAKGTALLTRQPGFPTPFAIRTLFDRHGTFWGATWSDGAFLVDNLRPGKPVALRRLDTANGLLAAPVRALFEDREGNIWIGGEMGVNMLRRVPISPVAGLPSNPATNHMLAADRDGVVYIADDHLLFRIRPAAQPENVPQPARLIEAICAAQRGGIGSSTETASFCCAMEGCPSAFRFRAPSLPIHVQRTRPGVCGYRRCRKACGWCRKVAHDFTLVPRGQARSRATSSSWPMAVLPSIFGAPLRQLPIRHLLPSPTARVRGQHRGAPAAGQQAADEQQRRHFPPA